MATSASQSAYFEPFDLFSPLFITTTSIPSLTGLLPRITNVFRQAINYFNDCCFSRTFKRTVTTNYPWLSQAQIDEISSIYFVLKNKQRSMSPLKLKKGSLIDGAKRASFSYLIREQDFIVYTGRCIGKGGSKIVDEVIIVRNDGTLDKASHVKLYKEKRNEKYLKLVEAEFESRRTLASPSILAPGDIYSYESKSGVKKFSWITPFYNRNAASVISKEKGIGMRFITTEKAMPKNVLALAYEMTQGLKVMHDKSWYHRDIKLENYLVLFDEEKSHVDHVALADTAFSIPFDQVDRLRVHVIDELKREMFGARLESEEAILALNPLFASLSIEGEYPSLDAYRSLHAKSRAKDPNFDTLCRFLETLDNRLIVGTPKHIAPELFVTRRYSTKVDLYALGFSFKRIKEQMESHILFDREIDVALDRLIERLTHTDPSMRPETDEVLGVLKSLQERLS